MPKKSKSKSRPRNSPLSTGQINAIIANLRKIFRIKGK
jgi:hypothetical protein